jgi:hypothetical protein
MSETITPTFLCIDGNFVCCTNFLQDVKQTLLQTRKAAGVLGNSVTLSIVKIEPYILLLISELGIRYFFPYSLIRYFNAAIRYRYSATFLNFAIRYRYSLFATSFDKCD